jgi:hypothetical protein
MIIDGKVQFDDISETPHVNLKINVAACKDESMCPALDPSDSPSLQKAEGDVDMLEESDAESLSRNANGEGPYQFIKHVDGRGNFNFEEGSRMCIIQNVDEHQWERSCRDFQIHHITFNQIE